MDNIEKLLIEGKKELDNLDIPENMEDRLRTTLDSIPNKKRRSNIKGKVAVLIIVALIIGYNANTLAYYTKRLIGYDNVMNGTLQELNELGKGQIIDKSYTFKNGVKVILDGIMLDDNNLILFHTIKDPLGKAKDAYSDLEVHQLEGLFGTTYNYGGYGEINEDGTEMKWIITCDRPRFFERKMKLKMYSSRMEETGIIEFKLDRNKAMGHNLKIPINKVIDVDQRKLKVTSLIASPTTTVIKGQIQNIVELGLDQITGQRFMPESIELVLIADGKEVELQSSSMSTDMKGSHFNVSYDALPQETKNVEIKLKSFGGNYQVNETIELEKGKINKSVKILEQDIRINEVDESKGNTYINIATDENLTLSKVLLDIDGKQIEADETVPGDYEKLVDEDSTKVNYTRTIKFKGTGEKLVLDVHRIRYNKSYDTTIYKYSVK